MRDEQRDGGRIDGAAKRADDIFRRRAQRPADADLRHHHGGENGPKPMQRKIAELGDGEGEDTGNRQAKTIAPLRLALAKPFAKGTPEILKSS